MFILVTPFSKTFDEIWLIYHVPDFLVTEINLWLMVEIPIRNNIEIAIILKIVDQWEINFDLSKIKSILSIIENNILLNDYQLKVLPWLADYYFTPIHNSACLFIPKNMRSKIEKKKFDITKTKTYNYRFDHNVELREKQIETLWKIRNSKNNKVLLHWVTGSWKTEVYIKLIKECLDKGKQSLFLIPEIILNNQLFERLESVFWDEILVINSTVTDAKKTSYWIDIHNNNAKIIIWTRSALFYPYDNLGLIIIDEEHDNSYQSDQAPRYNTIEVANIIADITWIKLLLWSGTPSLKTMFQAVKGKYELVSLLEVYH